MRLVVLPFVFFCCSLWSQTDNKLKVYYGLLHAHCMICDGVGTPEEAYKTAKESGVDFFALTPHNHYDTEDGSKERTDDVMIAYCHELYNGKEDVTLTRSKRVGYNTVTEKVTIKPLMQAAKEATTKNFVALYGQEFSSISKGNHVNVFGIDDVLEVRNGNFKGLVNVLQQISNAKAISPVMQLNHPNVQLDLFSNGTTTKPDKFNDYGIDAGDLGPHFGTLTQALNPYTHLLEMLCGPGMAKERNPDYRYNANENDYYFYLKQGMRISPTAGQDNHYATWGFITDARTGIVANELSEKAIYDACRKRRTFATEDKNLRTIMYVNDSLMGLEYTVGNDKPIRVKVQLSDADEPNTTYKIELYGSNVAAELSTEATNHKLRDGLIDRKLLTGNGTVTFSDVHLKGKTSFYFIKVIQEDDNRAWTAPVWVNYNSYKQPTTTSVKYYWSTSPSAKVYHIRGCSAVPTIAPQNVASGSTPPSGRKQHECNVPK